MHSLNNEFADEHKNLQTKLSTIQIELDQLIENEKNGCDSCRLHEKKINEFSTKNTDLNNDVATLKIVIFKLNAQIEFYQEKCSKLNLDSGTLFSQRTDNQSYEYAINSFWGSVNDHVLAPLLNSYEEIIAEKTELVNDQETEIYQVGGQLKSIINENEQLHIKMNELSRINDENTLEKTKMLAQLEVCRNKADIHSKRADLAKEKLIEILRLYEQKLQSQTIDMERLQESYHRMKCEIDKCKTMHQNPEAVAVNLRECEKLLEQMKIQHNDEKKKILEELKISIESKRSLEKEVQNQMIEIVQFKSNSKIQINKIK